MLTLNLFNQFSSQTVYIISLKSFLHNGLFQMLPSSNDGLDVVITKKLEITSRVMDGMKSKVDSNGSGIVMESLVMYHERCCNCY